MNNYIPLKENSNLLRDPETNAILNTNNTEYNNYIAMKNRKNEQNEKMVEMEREMINIKNDLNEIKDLLRKIAQ
jgi:hypothetical protein